jgi:hypothetical protein
MEILNHRAATKIKEFLAEASIASAPSLPAPQMRECVLHRDALA